MPGKRTKLLSLALSVFLWGSCAGVVVPNVEFCSVAGVIQAGADCAWTLSDKTETKTEAEFLSWLEATDPAVCTSAQDYAKIKTALEQACHLLGKRCTPEVKAALARMP